MKYSLHQKPFKDQKHQKAWLITVASNVCRDMLRKAESKTDLVGDFDEDTDNCWEAPVPSERADERSEKLGQAMSALDEKSRLVMYLMYYEEMSGAEIADIMGISENAVYVRASRARNKMKEVLSR